MGLLTPIKKVARELGLMEKPRRRHHAKAKGKKRKKLPPRKANGEFRKKK
jgi:hypothetical protein